MRTILISMRFNIKRAALAGFIASGAYLVEMVIDIAVLRYPFNDLKLLGKVINTKAWPIIGTIGHFTFGTFLGIAYAAVGYNLFPGSDWVRGILFVQVENNLLWALTPLIDRYHPAIRKGELPKLNTRLGYLGQLLRHIVYGAVLGLIYGKGQD